MKFENVSETSRESSAKKIPHKRTRVLSLFFFPGENFLFCEPQTCFKMASKDSDDRFAKIYSDPRFRTLKKKDKTLKIDNRFKSMFTEDRFKLKYGMDKRGKSRKHLIAEDYKKFYRLSDDENDDKEESKSEDKKGVDEEQNNLNEEEKSDIDGDEEKEEDSDDEDEPEIKLTHKFGYHRGLKSTEDSSSSSSSSESEESEVEDEEPEHDWGEVDRDAPRDDSITSRIAICNADWDKLNAQDLYVLLNSFKTATGAINYVRIYYSKFGEERLKVEEQKGPSEFIFGKSTIEETIDENEAEDPKEENADEENDEDEVQDSKTVEKLRKYQLERLKYFYAVVECDSADTAQVIYNELDGMEYESSSTSLDIRFIPDDMDFDDVKLKEECTAMPKTVEYEAPSFINTALQQSKVKLTWDEDDVHRKNALDKAFEVNNEDDLKVYLASSSEEEESDVEIDENMQESDKINKYKDLLKSLDDDKDDDVEMEVTWEPNLKTNAEDLINKNKTGEPEVDSGHDEDPLVSEEDRHDESDEEEKKRRAAKEKSKDKYKKWKKKKNAEPTEEVDSSNLELLMMDIDQSGENKKHFNYKKIVDDYSKKQTTEDDGFEVKIWLLKFFL